MTSYDYASAIELLLATAESELKQDAFERLLDEVSMLLDEYEEGASDD